MKPSPRPAALALASTLWPTCLVDNPKTGASGCYFVRGHDGLQGIQSGMADVQDCSLGDSHLFPVKDDGRRQGPS